MWQAIPGTGAGLYNNVIQQLMRGAVISILSIWEFYVVSLLSEAHNHVVHIQSETSTPEYSSDDLSSTDNPGSYKELQKINKWPDCQKHCDYVLRGCSPLLLGLHSHHAERDGTRYLNNDVHTVSNQWDKVSNIELVLSSPHIERIFWPEEAAMANLHRPRSLRPRSLQLVTLHE